MADASVAVTPGSGASMDTRTESTNSNHRQVVVLGDPAVNDAVATVTTPAASGFAALVARPHCAPTFEWSYAAAASGIVNTTAAVTIKAAAGASVRNYITSMQIMAEALTNATELAVRDGASGTVIWRTKIPTTGLLAGLNVVFPVPLRSTANTLLEVVTLTASGAGAVYFNAQGYVAP